MKKLDVTPISNSAQFFPKKGTLEFLQLAAQEGSIEIIKSLIGPTYSTSVMYILRGVVNSATYPSYNTTEGVVFYNGEYYLMDAFSFTATGSDVAVFSIVQSQYTIDADPCTFSDSTTHNIHDIRKMQLTAGATGSGLADYSAATRLSFTIPSQLNLDVATVAPYTDNIIQILGTYPNLFLYAPPTTDPLQPKLINLTNVLGNGATITKKSGSKNITSVSHDGTGRYTISHDIGHTNYFCNFIGLSAGYPYSVRSIDTIAANSFKITASDDSSLNDLDFQVQIFEYTP